MNDKRKKSAVVESASTKDPHDTWIILPDGPNQFDREVRAGALAYAKEKGFNRIRLADEVALRTTYMKGPSFQSGKLGVISHVRNTTVLKALAKRHIPTILLGQESVDEWKKLLGGACTVCSVDNESIGVMAAEYLNGQQRYKSFMFVEGQTVKRFVWWSHRRYETFRDTMHKYNKRTIPRVQLTIADPVREIKNFTEQLALLPKPVGIFACNDFIAREVISICNAAGISVPDQVGVLGVDNDADVCESSPIPISSIKVEHQRLGKVAVSLLIRALNGEEVRNRTILCPPTRVVERESTQKARPNNSFVARAVELISNADNRDLSVAEVVREIGASHSYLEKHFKLATGQSILEAIHAKRMADVTGLLIDTDEPLQQIAMITGFKSVTGLCALFKRRFGVSMSTYRANKRKLAGVM